ncbi:MAG: AmmeMemoRadiSam system protein A [Desulfomicrobium escambiense]|nr:AmmeMemoRadiSam system protein A [Desulfomicrobium escambiense]
MRGRAGRGGPPVSPRRPAGPRSEVLARTDSSSSGGPVVGYLAAALFAGTGDGPAPQTHTLSAEREGPPSYAWPGRPSPSSSRRAPRSRTVRGWRSSESRAGVFVTLTRNGQLRGCIGFIAPVFPLGQAVIQAAVYAATEDPRFPRVAASELAGLRFEISVLTPAREIDDPKAVKVGVHGLIVEKDGRSGVLLPQVAVDEGWDRTTFLDQVCLKAGLPRDAWKRDAKLSVFEAIVFHE